jgi:hypothetical protein
VSRTPRRIILALGAALVITSIDGCSLAFPVDGYQTLDPDARADDVSLIQQFTAQGSATSTLTVTLPKTPGIGNALVLAAASVENTPESVSGGAATWKLQKGSKSHVPLAIWVGFVDSRPSTAITVTWIGAQRTALAHVSEWRGPSAYGVADFNSGTAGGAITTKALTTGDRTALVFAAGAAHSAKIGPPNEGFSALPTVALDDTQLITAYLLAPSKALQVTSWSSDSTQSWEAIIVSLVR